MKIPSDAPTRVSRILGQCRDIASAGGMVIVVDIRTDDEGRQCPVGFVVGSELVDGSGPDLQAAHVGAAVGAAAVAIRAAMSMVASAVGELMGEDDEGEDSDEVCSSDQRHNLMVATNLVNCAMVREARQQGRSRWFTLAATAFSDADALRDSGGA